jgi:pyroglutamyl-peptidase
MRVLLTAFEPFDETGLNSSLEGCREFLVAPGSEWEIRFAVLPVRYGDDTAAVLEAMRDFDPDVLLHTGQGSRATEVRVERLAVNIRFSENEGPFADPHLPIDPEGPAALFSTLPADAVAAAISAAGVPATVSNHAGIYLCNHVLYRSLQRETGSRRRVGFLHIPPMPEQVGEGQPCLTPEETARGLRATLRLLEDERGRGPFTGV